MTAAEKDERSAKERLQASREALVNQLTKPKKPSRIAAPAQRGDTSVDFDERIGGEQVSPPVKQVSVRERAVNIWSAAKYGVRAWWEFHPVRAAGAVAEPLLADYAERRPFRLLGIAAGVGATVVVAKPWRLVSIGGLAVAVLKSSQASSFVLSLITQSKKQP
ncbi:hypothetical protein [Xylophilus ampelinus]|uniref:Uncharacterized protein n=1 Tax=Xylophilus ampelinus TaxID=54067 RepID=A0A318SEU7_9BURK|nr:hypothetical protein [Xylophilus ampelinus]MCS4511081.1 hypothetical protein [Xylophilus ampelinus]PYE75925.1 hypothetical protein DFQ15_11851 [Xylophilus ampelinus]